MKNEFIVDAVNKLQGFRTRLKECHYGAPTYNIHKLTDEFISGLADFEDDLVENATPLYGFILPGDLNPVLPEGTDFLHLLEDLRGLAITIKRTLGDDFMTSGIINLTDDFIQYINKYIYLVQIAEGKAREA